MTGPESRLSVPNPAVPQEATGQPEPFDLEPPETGGAGGEEGRAAEGGLLWGHLSHRSGRRREEGALACRKQEA